MHKKLFENQLQNMLFNNFAGTSEWVLVILMKPSVFVLLYTIYKKASYVKNKYARWIKLILRGHITDFVHFKDHHFFS